MSEFKILLIDDEPAQIASIQAFLNQNCSSIQELPESFKSLLQNMEEPGENRDAGK